MEKRGARYFESMQLLLRFHQATGRYVKMYPINDSTLTFVESTRSIFMIAAII